MVSRLYQGAQAIVDANGNVTLSFTTPGLSNVWTGTISVYNALGSELWTVNVSGQAWGTVRGSGTFGPVQAWNSDQITITASGLTPGTIYNATLIGTSEDAQTATPIGPSSQLSSVDVGTITGSVSITSGNVDIGSVNGAVSVYENNETLLFSSPFIVTSDGATRSIGPFAVPNGVQSVKVLIVCVGAPVQTQNMVVSIPADFGIYPNVIPIGSTSENVPGNPSAALFYVSPALTQQIAVYADVLPGPSVEIPLVFNGYYMDSFIAEVYVFGYPTPAASVAPPLTSGRSNGQNNVSRAGTVILNNSSGQIINLTSATYFGMYWVSDFFSVAVGGSAENTLYIAGPASTYASAPLLVALGINESPSIIQPFGPLRITMECGTPNSIIWGDWPTSTPLRVTILGRTMTEELFIYGCY
jgi:hypothetical protein